MTITSPNPYRAPQQEAPDLPRTRRYRVLAVWTLALFVPTLAQFMLLRTPVFSIEFAPIVFGVGCFFYVLIWRHYCRKAYNHDENEDASIRDRHPMVVRMSFLAFVAVLVSAALLLGLSVVTNTGPYDHPVAWLLLTVLFLCYKEIIVAYAISITRTVDDVHHG